MKTLTPDQFLKDVARHQMRILRDDGVYRHLKFRNPATFNQWFELITYPGALVIGGDMGTYVFERVDDMFKFFRRDDLSINAYYWEEKCEAADTLSGGTKTFDADAFKAAVLESLDGYGLEPEQHAEIVQRLQNEVFTGEDNEHDLRRALEDFEHDDFEFSELWEISGRVYVFRFLWCLYAIVWGIQQYDAGQAKAGAA